MAFIVPPGGLAGFNQMTPASKARLGQGVRGTRSGTKRRKGRKRRKSKYGGGGLSPVRAPKRGRAKSPYTRRLKRKSKGPKFGTPAFNKKHGVGQFAKRR